MNKISKLLNFTNSNSGCDLPQKILRTLWEIHMISTRAFRKGGVFELV